MNGRRGKLREKRARMHELDEVPLVVEQHRPAGVAHAAAPPRHDEASVAEQGLQIDRLVWRLAGLVDAHGHGTDLLRTA
jgi:hypothetical protein